MKIPDGFLECVKWVDFFQTVFTSELKEERAMLSRHKFAFGQRVVKMGNGLPAEVVTVSVARDFKKPARSPR